jgi:uncharacterized RDD family membrane protein YckC
MEEVYVPSTWRRLWAHLLDTAFSTVMYLPFFGIFYKLIFTNDEVHASLMQVGIMFLIPAVYEFIFLALMQATPGKWLMGLKVVPNHNPDLKLELGQCLLRPLTARLSVIFSLAIYALAFFRYDRTHLCDWVAETRVVQFKPRPSLPRIRWALGVLFILSHSYEGLGSASKILQQVDWNQGRIDLRAVMQNTSNASSSDFSFDGEGDDDE